MPASDPTEKKTDRIPIGEEARKAMNVEESLLRFFPPVSRMSYGRPLPWGTGEPQIGRKGERHPSPATLQYSLEPGLS